jgi:hypothetical protein
MPSPEGGTLLRYPLPAESARQVAGNSAILNLTTTNLRFALTDRTDKTGMIVCTKLQKEKNYDMKPKDFIFGDVFTWYTGLILSVLVRVVRGCFEF